jgi:hypothetical protein
VTGVLQLSKVRKVAAAVTAAGNPLTANAFGLPAVATCPGATPTCLADCYAVAIGRAQKASAAMLQRNLDALTAAGTEDAMAGLIGAAIDAFRREHALAGARGIASTAAFRVHWSGDFFSRDYARAWRRGMLAAPDVVFWAYTRSFGGEVDVLDVLAEVPNLRLYLSADADNVTAAAAARARYPQLRWAWLGETFADGLAALPEGTRRYPCPENGRRIPMISPAGSACIRCGICPEGRGDVVFSITRR